MAQDSIVLLTDVWEVFGTYGAFDVDWATEDAEDEDAEDEGPKETKRAFAATKAGSMPSIDSGV